MTSPEPSVGFMLRVSRTFAAPRDRVFRAWTQPAQLMKWWGLHQGYTTPIAEVDLKVGGRYRLGMKPPDEEHTYISTGVFREVRPPERLVYTWTWEGTPMTDLKGRDTIVTVEFHDLGASTEVVLTHEFLPSQEARDQHGHGWAALMERMAKVVE